MPGPYEQASATTTQTQGKVLDWRERPAVIREAIKSAFDNIAKGKHGGWMYNGREKTYDLISVNEHELLVSIILSRMNSNPNDKNFYVLDVGAGEFRVINDLSNKLNSDPRLPDDIKIHLVGVRGEPLTYNYNGPDPEVAVTTNGKCTTYEIGYFQIENIHDEFHKLLKKGTIPDLFSKVDLAISAMTLIHLIDGLGTIAQVFDLLEKGGLLLSDGLFLSVPEEEGVAFGPGLTAVDEMSNPIIERNWNLYQLLHTLPGPFLIGFDEREATLNRILIKKSGPLALQLEYDGLAKQPCHYYNRFPNEMASFKRTQKPPLTSKILPMRLNYFNVSGSWELFHRLMQDNVISSKPFHFIPLFLAFNNPDSQELQDLSPDKLLEELKGRFFVKGWDADRMIYENRFFSNTYRRAFDRRWGIVPHTEHSFVPKNG